MAAHIVDKYNANPRSVVAAGIPARSGERKLIMWLICAATEFELATWPEAGGPECRRVVSGVGIPATFLALLPIVAAGGISQIVNIGIAGAYPSSGLWIGDLVFARDEVYGDLGMELPDGADFQMITSTPFGSAYATPFPAMQPEELASPPIATHRGATVNACTGTDATGHLRERLLGAGFETMEGAAVAQIGSIYVIPVCELRAISNIAARRDMRGENIRRALGSLRDFLTARLVV